VLLLEEEIVELEIEEVVGLLLLEDETAELEVKVVVELLLEDDLIELEL
jgi:hypothetical protein